MFKKKYFKPNTIFISILFILNLIILGTLWATPYLPMQDLPQHLHQTLIYHYRNTNHIWNSVYDSQLSIGPYCIFYYLTNLFYTLTNNILISAKLFISLCFILYSILTLYIYNITKKSHTPWIALTIPLIYFNQTYFLGLTNYIFAIPITTITIIHYFRTKQNLTKKTNIINHIYLILGPSLILLSHPFCLLLYIGTTLSLSFYIDIKQKKIDPKTLYPCLFAILFLAWNFTINHPTETAPLKGFWSPLTHNISYLLVFFQNMKKTNIISCLSWLSIIMTYLYYLLKFKQVNKKLFIIFQLLLICCATLYFTLPTIIHPILKNTSNPSLLYPAYGYFNLRIAPFIYLFLIITLSQIRTKKYALFIITIALSTLTLDISKTHLNTAKEVHNEVEKMNKTFTIDTNTFTVLPLSFNNVSKNLNSIHTYQFFAHIHHYLNINRKAGYTTTFFNNKLQPIKIKRKIKHVPTQKNLNPKYFNWSKHGQYYKHILIKNPPKQFSNTLPNYYKIENTYKNWTLLKNTKKHVKPYRIKIEK